MTAHRDDEGYDQPSREAETADVRRNAWRACTSRLAAPSVGKASKNEIAACRRQPAICPPRAHMRDAPAKAKPTDRDRWPARSWLTRSNPSSPRAPSLARARSTSRSSRRPHDTAAPGTAEQVLLSFAQEQPRAAVGGTRSRAT